MVQEYQKPRNWPQEPVFPRKGRKAPSRHTITKSDLRNDEGEKIMEGDLKRRLQLKPGEGTQGGFALGPGHRIGVFVVASVPDNLGPSKACIGSSIPRMIKRTIKTILIHVSQNSNSPYRRTLRAFDATGIIAIHNTLAQTGK